MSPKTRVLKVDPKQPDARALDEAAAILRAGGLVAFPTETVYGLGADATNADAVARIFEAKGRPAVNPLIVHGHSVGLIRKCVSEWPRHAADLARLHWPGPLTLILPRSETIPDIVTAGRNTVGVRIPRHPVAQSLIHRFGRAVAAPSANRSTGVSPTLAEHVLKDLDGKIDLILDAGPTRVGIESTVLDLSSIPPKLLRPGAVSKRDLEAWPLEYRTPDGRVSRHVLRPKRDPTGALSSPGQMAVHYAPRTPTFRVERQHVPAFPWPALYALLNLGFVRDELRDVPAPVARFDPPDRQTAAATLYATLHTWDDLALDAIVIVMPDPEWDDWEAIVDRIRRASKPWPDETSP